MKKKIEEYLADLIIFTGLKYSKTELHKFFKNICINSYFSAFIIFCIFINTISLSLDRYPIDYDFYMKLEIVNNTCTFIFVAEMIIKLFGLGLNGYLQDV